MKRPVPPKDCSGEISPAPRTHPVLRVADATALVLSVVLCSALAFLAVNQPWVSDDFTNATFIRDNPGLADSVSFYYRTWTGRFSSSALTWLAAQIRPAYGVLLWAAILGLVVMTFALARGRMPRLRRADLSILALVLVTYWFGMPAIEETVFWTTGSTVYLWPAVLTLLFLYPYRRYAAGLMPAARPVRSATLAMGMLALGIWVGGSQEQVLVACVAFLAILGVPTWRSKALSRLPAHLYAGAVGLVGAGLVSLVAPGNGQRLTEVPPAGVAATVVASVKYLVHIAVDWLPPLIPWLLFLGVLSAAALAGRDDLNSRRPTQPRLLGPGLWLVLGIATISPLLLQPYFGAQRTIMFLAVFLVVGALSLGEEEERERMIDRLPKAALSVTLSIVLLVTLGDVALSGWQARRLRVAQEQRAAFVHQQREAGITQVRVPRLTDETPRRGVIWNDGTTDPSFWVNGVMAGWYGVDALVVTDSVGTGYGAEQ